MLASLGPRRSRAFEYDRLLMHASAQSTISYGKAEPTHARVFDPSSVPSTTPAILSPFFRLAVHSPMLTRACRPLATRFVPIVSREVRTNTRLNATRIFGRELPRREQARFTRAVVDHFYQFVADIGRCSRESNDELFARIEAVEGEATFKAARRAGRGAVLVTAHMGSFEVGLGALRHIEPRIRVVFKRDASGPFESMRAAMRRKLGILETPIDDGLAAWADLRHALLNDEIVVLQGDRAVPGQRSLVVPFLHGHLRIPTGPLRLARLTGSPIIPVFTVRSGDGRYRVSLHSPIDPNIGTDTGGLQDPGVMAIARAIESMVARHPEQWLVLHRAFEEDTPRA